jgi:alkylated DNA repair dioxygenase AlkB
MAGAQLNFFGGADPLVPEGFAYRADLIDAREERALAPRLAELPFRAFEFHGFTGHRRTVSYGWHYAFDGSGLQQSDEMPDWLLPVRAAAAGLAGLVPEALEHALLIEYGPGAGIGWHRDRPVFGDVVGVSLLSEAPLRFRLKQGEKWRRFTLRTAPRSAYLLRGPARTEWEHSLAPVATHRYSATFRTLR